MAGEADALLLTLVAILFPPAAVAFVAGCGVDLCINILLTMLGYLPGCIHAFWIVLKRTEANERFGYKNWVYTGMGEYAPYDERRVNTAGQPRGAPQQPAPVPAAAAAAPPAGQPPPPLSQAPVDQKQAYASSAPTSAPSTTGAGAGSYPAPQQAPPAPVDVKSSGAQAAGEDVPSSAPATTTEQKYDYQAPPGLPQASATSDEKQKS